MTKVLTCKMPLQTAPPRAQHGASAGAGLRGVSGPTVGQGRKQGREHHRGTWPHAWAPMPRHIVPQWGHGFSQALWPQDDSSICVWGCCRTTWCSRRSAGYASSPPRSCACPLKHVCLRAGNHMCLEGLSNAPCLVLPVMLPVVVAVQPVL